MRSCITPVSAVRGEITTLEGLSKNGKLHPLQQAWIDEQVPQCGYCQNGQIMTAKALLDRNPNPTDAEIRDGMEGALCRCMTYYRIQAAIKRVVRGTATAAARTQANEHHAAASESDRRRAAQRQPVDFAPGLPRGLGRAGRQPGVGAHARRQRARAGRRRRGPVSRSAISCSSTRGS